MCRRLAKEKSSKNAFSIEEKTEMRPLHGRTEETRLHDIVNLWRTQTDGQFMRSFCVPLPQIPFRTPCPHAVLRQSDKPYCFNQRGVGEKHT
jgi:hypothetical protein